MSIENLYNKEGYAISRAVVSTNKYGESKFIESESTSFDCAVQPQSGDYEVTIQGKVVKVTHNLYCATTVEVSAGDEIKVDDIRYRVLSVLDECSQSHHLKILLERIS
jgi:SPP1 family predicted phage head-tail adaptor